MTYTMEGGAAVSIPRSLLAKMTPEQRARTEAKLKARAAQRPRIETKRFCLTEEKLNKAILDDQDSKSCRRTIVASTPTLLQFREECAGGDLKRTADARFEALDVETMKGSMKADSTGTNTLHMNVDLAGKWIGADCGDAAR
jgi:hypothetical protein